MISLFSAYQNNEITTVMKGEVAYLPCNPSVDDLVDMINWASLVRVANGAEFYIELADGVHGVSSHIMFDSVGSSVEVRGTSTGDELSITSISYASIGGGNYRCTAGVSQPLPSHIEPGSVVGLFNVVGTNDVASCNGGQVVETIYADRLKFTFDLQSARTLANGSLKSSASWYSNINKCIAYRVTLKANSDGWNGTGVEGFANVKNGQLVFKWLGVAYDGAEGTEHDLIHCQGNLSRFYAERCGFSGAGDKVLRQYGPSEMHLNLSCVGGNTTAQEIWQGTAGSKAEFIRCFAGSASKSGLVAGPATNANFAQGILSNAPTLVSQTSPDSGVSVAPALLSNASSRGIYAIHGHCYITSGTQVERCATGLDWLASGFIIGPSGFGTGSQANGRNAENNGNTEENGGGWYKNIADGL